MVELGFVGREALALRAQLRLQPGEVRLGDQSVDPVPSGPAVAWPHAEHLAAPPGDGRGDAAGRARRANDAELVHRLEQMRRCGIKRLVHRDSPGEAEGELRAVDAVIAAV